jgi:hypothetical protein
MVGAYSCAMQNGGSAAHMKTPYEQIGEKFLAELEKSKDVSLKKVEALRLLFAGGKKLKADDLVKIFASAEEDDIK